MSDQSVEELDKNIRAALERDPRINLHASQLKIIPHERCITLVGQTEDISSKRIAVNVVRQTAGEDYEIKDHIRIHSTHISDNTLHDKIARILVNEPVFSDCDIFVDSTRKIERLRNSDLHNNDVIKASVRDGVITLTGQVNSLTHRRMAEALMWWIDGCQRVDNLLRVVPPERETDEELTDAVRMVLKKDPLIDASQIRVVVTAGVVELLGHLENDKLCRIAAHDVWSVPDVWEVYNRITADTG